MNLASTIEQLYQQYGQLTGITIECQNDLVAIGIKNKAAIAEVFLQGAQLTRYQRVNEKPHIFLSDACRYQQGQSLRGGIPICWPWFGDLHKNPKAITQQYTEEQMATAPSHGIVRNRNWRVDSIAMPTDQLTIIELACDIDGSDFYWPFATELSYRLEIGKSLSASLLVKNVGDKSTSFSSALHTYFAVSHIQEVNISGFNQASYIDALDQWKEKTQAADISFSEEVDRIYKKGCLPANIIDGERVITVTSTGSNSSVVWNPWVEKSQRLSQFKDEEYQCMVCIETANAVDDTVTLLPNSSHVLQVTII